MLNFPPRRTLPLHSAREAEPGHSLHTLPFFRSPTGYCRAALPGLAGRPGPVWPGLAGRWQRPIPHQCPSEELRRRWTWSADGVQQPQPYWLSWHHSLVWCLLLPRYWECCDEKGLCSIIAVIAKLPWQRLGTWFLFWFLISVRLPITHEVAAKILYDICVSPGLYVVM